VARIYSEEDPLQELIPTAIYYREKLGPVARARLLPVFAPRPRPSREILEEQFEAPSEPFNLAKAIPVARNVSLDAEAADAVAAVARRRRGKGSTAAGGKRG
jgi:hypothetical protein